MNISAMKLTELRTCEQKEFLRSSIPPFCSTYLDNCIKLTKNVVRLTIKRFFCIPLVFQTQQPVPQGEKKKQCL